MSYEFFLLSIGFSVVTMVAVTVSLVPARGPPVRLQLGFEGIVGYREELADNSNTPGSAFFLLPAERHSTGALLRQGLRPEGPGGQSRSQIYSESQKSASSSCNLNGYVRPTVTGRERRRADRSCPGTRVTRTRMSGPGRELARATARETPWPGLLPVPPRPSPSASQDLPPPLHHSR